LKRASRTREITVRNFWQGTQNCKIRYRRIGGGRRRCRGRSGSGGGSSSHGVKSQPSSPATTTHFADEDIEKFRINPWLRSHRTLAFIVQSFRAGYAPSVIGGSAT